MIQYFLSYKLIIYFKKIIMSKTKFNTSDIRKIEELMKIDIIDDRF